MKDTISIEPSDVGLLPAVGRFVWESGVFELTKQTLIVAPERLGTVANWLQEALRPATGFNLAIGESESNLIRLATSPALPAEGYELHMDPDQVEIIGGSPAGVFYGCQVLRQLLPAPIFRQAFVEGVAWALRCGRITDAPRFHWRGFMLDVARHFLPKREVFRYLDLMAMHRLNVLHLHLTDDQGWRVEIKKYPRLTEVGAWRAESQLGGNPSCGGDGRPHGGFYTQDDIHEIVSYAAGRFIQIVPEVDMPGHVQSALAAYPEYSVSRTPGAVGTRWGVMTRVASVEEDTVHFFMDIITELTGLFPGLFFHVGGDECPRIEWQSDGRTQELMKERELVREADLQAWFMDRIGQHLASLGRRMVGWDEILEGDVPDGTVVSVWRGTRGAVAAARRGYQVVACPDELVYLNFRPSELAEEPIPVGPPLSLEKAYSFNPIPSGLTAEEESLILGGQANLWTEQIDSPRTLDYFAFPRLCAIAEALWSCGSPDFGDFRRRLDMHLLRLKELGVEYRMESGPLPWQQRPGVVGLPVSSETWHARTERLVREISN